ncbi:MAG: hypothetical protein L6R37_007923 [Teloschistes peruensis]|nr:MAG: hypothetical protein L6R37_007923 [Teloschistes peruensis]
MNLPNTASSGPFIREHLLNDRRHALEKAVPAIAEVLKEVQLANATVRSVGGHNIQDICVSNRDQALVKAIALYSGVMKHPDRMAHSLFTPNFEQATYERIFTMIKQIKDSAQLPADHAPFSGHLGHLSPSTAMSTTPQSKMYHAFTPVAPATSKSVPMQTPNTGPSPMDISPPKSSSTQPSLMNISPIRTSSVQPSPMHTSSIQTAQTKPSQAYIHAHTVLQLRHPASNAAYVPVKMRSCLTMVQLFATAAKAWDMPVDKIAALRIRSESGTIENMRIKMEVPDSFECFVEMVEKMWGVKKAECKIDVGIEVKG